MIDLIDLEALVASAEAFGEASAPTERKRLLGQIRDRLETLRIADEQAKAELEEAYRRPAEQGISTVGADQAASVARETESATVEELVPRIESLRRYLTDTSWRDDSEAHQLLQEAVNIAVGYIAGYPKLREQFFRISGDNILRARPVQGEVDHDALSREFIARFPKLRAALAK
jgi:hypothetical protein